MTQTSEASSTPPIRILVVEDVKTMQELLREVIAGISGFVVSGVAGNGPEARFELSRRFPDLVLLDEILPGESSTDLLSEFDRLKLPVILISGMQTLTHPLPEGVLGRIRKPAWEELSRDRKRVEREIRSFLKQSRHVAR